MRLLADENFRGEVIAGLRKRIPGLDLIRVQDVGLMQTPDEDILAWAAQHDRILLTHDISTMPDAAIARVKSGLPMPGMAAVSGRLPVGSAINGLEVFICCSFAGEWEGMIYYLTK